MVEITRNALMITGFVTMMMLVIEYLNVLTIGSWQKQLARYAWGQHLLAAFLGAMPGCLGAFAVVTMFAHGALTLGAVVAAMIATSGDEAFVMLAIVPRQALLLTAILIILGIGAGVLTDLLTARRRTRSAACEGLEVHAGERCECFPRGRILSQWKECSPARGTLGVLLVVFLAGVVAGQLGPAEWNWIRISLVAASGTALFIACTAPDHFLEKHLWEHVMRKHLPRVFLWTSGALVAIHLLNRWIDLTQAIQRSGWVVLLVACLAGLIPESGPHLLFVTLFAGGAIPFSILLASSIVQDGHGMLPLLAHSRAEFLAVKGINFLAGLLAGAAAMSMGV